MTADIIELLKIPNIHTVVIRSGSVMRVAAQHRIKVSDFARATYISIDDIDEINIDITPSNIKLEEVNQTLYQIESLWRRMVEILLPSTRSLIEGCGVPHSSISGLFVISMKSPTMRTIAVGKIPEISKALGQILGRPIAVKLFVRGVEVA